MFPSSSPRPPRRCTRTGDPDIRVSAGRIGELYEGRSRPGHFDGVLTVVAKLLLIVTPDVVTFGKKDAQQLYLVRRMITDLNIPVRLEAIEIVREDDGLALSSRNRYLEGKERRAARTLSLALEAARPPPIAASMPLSRPRRERSWANR